MTYYVIRTRVAKVERKSRDVRISKAGIAETEDLGWFALFEGSREMIFLGNEKPALAEGDRVKITIERL